jgi:hypothetical protein
VDPLRSRPRLSRSGALLAALALLPVSSAHAQPQPITLTAACQDARMTVTIRNAGSEDTALMIGAVLANGRKYLVGELRLSATFPDGHVSGYTYSPADYPAAIGGRLDPWILTLPAGVSYVMPVTPAQFRTSAMGRLAGWPNPGRVSFTLGLMDPGREKISPDRAGLSLMKVWHGVDALRSNDIATAGECR